jgi:ribosomal protein S15P/S13E
MTISVVGSSQKNIKKVYAKPVDECWSIKGKIIQMAEHYKFHKKDIPHRFNVILIIPCFNKSAIFLVN